MKKLLIACCLPLALNSLPSQADITSLELKTGWPSEILCRDVNDQREWLFQLTHPRNGSGGVTYSAFYNKNGLAGFSWLSFNSDRTFAGLYSGGVGTWDCGTNQWSIEDLNTNGRAFYQFYYQPKVEVK
ncbi:hypothetical protein [Agarivorans sp. Alg241-V36]|uniref:hypothetical protein n=1 Tax=Agarivorans sp. Alg241-V36 TaxID=2305992 RepID=UPI0013D76B44|nr:hypothetical protein [Agarivorans sp. Alg241-V36]